MSKPASQAWLTHPNQAVNLSLRILKRRLTRGRRSWSRRLRCIGGWRRRGRRRRLGWARLSWRYLSWWWLGRWYLGRWWLSRLRRLGRLGRLWFRRFRLFRIRRWRWRWRLRWRSGSDGIGWIDRNCRYGCAGWGWEKSNVCRRQWLGRNRTGYDCWCAWLGRGWLVGARSRADLPIVEIFQ